MADHERKPPETGHYESTTKDPNSGDCLGALFGSVITTVLAIGTLVLIIMIGV